MESVLNMLRHAVKSRTACKMEFPHTRFIWITALLKVIETEVPYLLVDHVAGFKAAHEENPNGTLWFEFRDRERVPCLFDTQVVMTDPEGILVDLPQIIYRMQQREYFRVDAPAGSTITFFDGAGKKQSGVIFDVSGRGISFLVSDQDSIGRGDLLQDIELAIPAEKKNFHIVLPAAHVKRLEKTDTGRILIGVDFAEIDEHVRRRIIAYVFQRHRSTVRKIGR